MKWNEGVCDITSKIERGVKNEEEKEEKEKKKSAIITNSASKILRDQVIRSDLKAQIFDL